jgi:hypothetical protein
MRTARDLRRTRLTSTYASLWWSVVVAIAAATTAASSQTERPTVGPNSTARLSGDVVNDEVPPRPVRRAIVSLTGEGLAIRRSVITDDGGRFEFTGLPAGRFTLTSSRASLLAVPYGATQTSGLGRAIALRDAQAVTDVHLRMVRGAAVTGTVRDAAGEPAPDIQIVMWSRTTRGDWIERPPLVRTDDRGIYRVYGLAPGPYIVMARMTNVIVGGIQAPMTTAIDDALRELARATPSSSPLSTRTFAFAPILYPDALTTTDALPLNLSTGEERAGIDLTIRLVPTATIDGEISAPSGQSLPSVLLNVTSNDVVGAQTVTVRAEQNGRFRYPNVSPGKYVLTARSTSWDGPAVMVGPTTGPRRGPCYWATTEVNVAGSDVSGVVVMLQPCLTVRGHVLFQAEVLPPPDLKTVHVRALPKTGHSTSTGFAPSPDLPQVAVAEDGQFEIGDLLPGEYQFTASAPGAGSTGWWLRSIMLDGRDLLDDGPAMIEANTNGRSDLTVVFSDRHTILSGILQMQSGATPADLIVVVFPADLEIVRPESRRIQAARLDSAGRFEFRDLPAGEYRLAALSDLVPDGWQQSAFLASLVPSSVRVTLADGEHKVRDLRILGKLPADR